MIAASSPDKRGQGRAQAVQVFRFSGVQVFRVGKVNGKPVVAGLKT